MVTMPEPVGVTTPPELTVATEVLLLLQVPPEGEAVKVVVAVPQIVLDPDTVADAFTVTTR
jgi:hypothetical protein